MYLTGVVFGTGVHILVDTGSTHNIIDINVARLIGLHEPRIDTTILVDSGNNVTCRVASFNVPLRNDKAFNIDAFLLDIGNDIDVILGTPWLARLGCLTWDLTTMELQYHDHGCPVTFASLRPQRRLTMVLALPAPAPIRRAAREHQAPSSPPCNITLRASRSKRPNALDQFSSICVPVFTELRRAVPAVHRAL
jgi:hypothetical protein